MSSTCTIPELPEILGFRSSQRKFLRALVLVWQNCDRYMLLTVSGIACKEFFSPVSRFNTLQDQKIVQFSSIFNPLSPEGGWIFTPPWKNVFLKSWYLRFIKWDFKNWVNQWMATNISYILMHKSKFFETFLNNLQTVSIEYRKRLKKVGILRVK